jgi:hypothetical protein
VNVLEGITISEILARFLVDVKGDGTGQEGVRRTRGILTRLADIMDKTQGLFIPEYTPH